LLLLIFFVFIFIKLHYGFIIADSIKKIAEREKSLGSAFFEKKKIQKNEIIKTIFIRFLSINLLE
jgi:hypothetical protein